MVMKRTSKADAASLPMEPRLGRRLVSNYLAQLFNQGIRVVEQIILVPLYLQAWGVDLYKDWMLLSAIAWFMMFFNLGTDYYFGNLFLTDVSRGDLQLFRRHLRTALFCTVTISTCSLLVFYTVASAVDITELLQMTAIDRHSAYLILVLLSAPMAVLISEQVLHSIYRAWGDFTRGECIYGIYTSIQLTCVALALFLRQPPWVVALCYLIMPTLFSAALLIDLLRRYPEVTIGLTRPSRSELKEIIPQSALYFTFTISLVLVQNGTLLLFGVLGVSAIAIVSYNAYRIFTGLTQSVAYQFAIGSGIEMARLLARGEREACRRLYAETGRIVASLTGLLAGVSIPASGPFIALWTKGAVSDQLPLLAAFLLGIVGAGPGQASIMLLRYTNRPRPLAMAWLGQSVAGLLLASVLYPLYGVDGAALAFSICQLIALGVFLPLVVQRLHGFSATKHLLASYAAGLLAFALSYLAAITVFAFPVPGFAGLGLKGAAWGAVMAVPALLLILPAARRRTIVNRLRRAWA